MPAGSLRSVTLFTPLLLLLLMPACASTDASPIELEVVGRLDISAGPENITDLWAHAAPDGRSYAYLGSYDQPRCGEDITGVHIVDITDPANPMKVGLIPSPAGNKVSDVMVAHLETPSFRGDILVESVEFCRGEPRRPAAENAGIVLYDVTDPLNPRATAPGFSLGFEVHNAFAYQQSSRAFVLVVQDDSERDFHIVEITDPAAPTEVAARGWRDWFDENRDQLRLGEMPVALLHDVWAQSYPANHSIRAYAGKTIAYLSYWDAGLVLLDVTDPANPVFLGDSDYLDPDPVSGQPPEGNSHSAVPTADGRLVFMGDEDISASHVAFTVDDGSFAGRYRAAEARFTPRLAEMNGARLTGPATFVGSGCPGQTIAPADPAALAPGEVLTAVIERGACNFDDKIAGVAAAGYGRAIVVAAADAPNAVISMSGDPAKGVIPAFFVARPTGFAILGFSPDSAPQTPLPPPGTAGSRVSTESVLDGWGYGRILDVSDPTRIVELGQFITENVMARPVAGGPPRDHTMHNVIVEGRRAYISWYADGIRVVDFSDPKKPREVGRFVDQERGSNFWGVYLFRHPDSKTYILGSDRDTGLWIFRAPG